MFETFEITNTNTKKYFICDKGLKFNVDSRGRVKVVKSTIPKDWDWTKQREYVNSIYSKYKSL